MIFVQNDFLLGSAFAVNRYLIIITIIPQTRYTVFCIN